MGTVGVLGAGRMGLPVISHLVRAGFPVVVYDVDPAKRETVTGEGAEFVTDSGDVGAGQVGKAVNNLILWACLVADHEGLALAERCGVDAGKLRSALRMSSAANHALDNWGNQTMAWAEDDMQIVQDMAAEAGIGLPQTALNREICRVLKPRRYQHDKYGL